MSDHNGKIELWFFRDLADAQRMELFKLLGFPTDELGTLGRQKLAINVILAAKDIRLQSENDRLRSALEAIAHTFTEDSHGNTKTMDAPYYQGIARAALEAKP